MICADLPLAQTGEKTLARSQPGKDGAPCSQHRVEFVKLEEAEQVDRLQDGRARPAVLVEDQAKGVGAEASQGAEFVVVVHGQEAIHRKGNHSPLSPRKEDGSVSSAVNCNWEVAGSSLHFFFFSFFCSFCSFLFAPTHILFATTCIIYDMFLYSVACYGVVMVLFECGAREMTKELRRLFV